MNIKASVRETPVLQHGGDDEISTGSVVAYSTFLVSKIQANEK